MEQILIHSLTNLQYASIVLLLKTSPKFNTYDLKHVKKIVRSIAGYQIEIEQEHDPQLDPTKVQIIAMYELNSSFKYCEQLYCGDYHSGAVEFVANSLAKKTKRDSSQLDYLPFKMHTIPVFPRQIIQKTTSKPARNYLHLYKNENNMRNQGSQGSLNKSNDKSCHQKCKGSPHREQSGSRVLSVNGRRRCYCCDGISEAEESPQKGIFFRSPKKSAYHKSNPHQDNIDSELTTKKGGNYEESTHKKFATTVKQSSGFTERQKVFQPFKPYMQTKIEQSKTYRTAANTHYFNNAVRATKQGETKTDHNAKTKRSPYESEKDLINFRVKRNNLSSERMKGAVMNGCITKKGPNKMVNMRSRKMLNKIDRREWENERQVQDNRGQEEECQQEEFEYVEPANIYRNNNNQVQIQQRFSQMSAPLQHRKKNTKTLNSEGSQQQFLNQNSPYRDIVSLQPAQNDEPNGKITPIPENPKQSSFFQRSKRISQQKQLKKESEKRQMYAVRKANNASTYSETSQSINNKSLQRVSTHRQLKQPLFKKQGISNSNMISNTSLNNKQRSTNRHLTFGKSNVELETEVTTTTGTTRMRKIPATQQKQICRQMQHNVEQNSNNVNKGDFVKNKYNKQNKRKDYAVEGGRCSKDRWIVEPIRKAAEAKQDQCFKQRGNYFNHETKGNKQIMQNHKRISIKQKISQNQSKELSQKESDRPLEERNSYAHVSNHHRNYEAQYIESEAVQAQNNQYKVLNLEPQTQYAIPKMQSAEPTKRYSATGPILEKVQKIDNSLSQPEIKLTNSHKRVKDESKQELNQVILFETKTGRSIQQQMRIPFQSNISQNSGLADKQTRLLESSKYSRLKIADDENEGTGYKPSAIQPQNNIQSTERQSSKVPQQSSSLLQHKKNVSHQQYHSQRSSDKQQQDILSLNEEEQRQIQKETLRYLGMVYSIHQQEQISCRQFRDNSRAKTTFPNLSSSRDQQEVPQHRFTQILTINNLATHNALDNESICENKLNCSNRSVSIGSQDYFDFQEPIELDDLRPLDKKNSAAEREQEQVISSGNSFIKKGISVSEKIPECREAQKIESDQASKENNQQPLMKKYNLTSILDVESKSSSSLNEQKPIKAAPSQQHSRSNNTIAESKHSIDNFENCVTLIPGTIYKNQEVNPSNRNNQTEHIGQESRCSSYISKDKNQENIQQPEVVANKDLKLADLKQSNIDVSLQHCEDKQIPPISEHRIIQKQQMDQQSIDLDSLQNKQEEDAMVINIFQPELTVLEQQSQENELKGTQQARQLNQHSQQCPKQMKISHFVQEDNDISSPSQIGISKVKLPIDQHKQTKKESYSVCVQTDDILPLGLECFSNQASYAKEGHEQQQIINQTNQEVQAVIVKARRGKMFTCQPQLTCFYLNQSMQLQGDKNISIMVSESALKKQQLNNFHEEALIKNEREKPIVTHSQPVNYPNFECSNKTNEIEIESREAQQISQKTPENQNQKMHKYPIETEQHESAMQAGFQNKEKPLQGQKRNSSVQFLLNAQLGQNNVDTLPPILDKIILKNISIIELSLQPIQIILHKDLISNVTLFIKLLLPEYLDQLINRQRTKICLYFDNQWTIFHTVSPFSTIEQVISTVIVQFNKGEALASYQLLEWLTATPIRTLKDKQTSTSNKRLLRSLDYLLNNKEENQLEISRYVLTRMPNNIIVLSQIRHFIDETKSQKTILECLTVDSTSKQYKPSWQAINFCGESMSSFLEMHLLVNPYFYHLELDKTINTFELELPQCILYLQHTSKFILYEETSRNEYSLVKQSHSWLRYINTKGRSTVLLIVEPLSSEEYSSQIMLRVGLRKGEDPSTISIIKQEEAMRTTERGGGYQNKRSIYLPVERELKKVRRSKLSQQL